MLNMEQIQQILMIMLAQEALPKNLRQRMYQDFLLEAVNLLATDRLQSEQDVPIAVITTLLIEKLKLLYPTRNVPN